MAIAYVSKAGLDTNDGLTALTSKLTIGACNSLYTAGNNALYVGVGDFSTETITYSSSGKILSIIGDYNGAIFGTAAGVVKIPCKLPFCGQYLDTVHYVTMVFAASCSPIHGGSTANHNQTYNYVVFQLGNPSPLIGREGCYRRKVTFNYCSHTTYALTMFSHNYNGRLREIVINNWDGYTGGQYFQLLNAMTSWSNIKVRIYNSNLVYSALGLHLSSGYDMYFENCNLSQASISSPIADMPEYILTSLDGVYAEQGGGFYHLKNCNFYAYDKVTPRSFYAFMHSNSWTITTWYIQSLHEHTAASLYYGAKAKILLEGINGNATRKILMNGLDVMEDTTETRLGLPIVRYRHKGSNTTTHWQPHVWRLNGLAPSTSYLLTVNLNAAVRAATSCVRLGILKGTQCYKTDLYANPNLALATLWADANDFTNGLWAEQVLGFTTPPATEAEEIFFVFYSEGNDEDLKITVPYLTLS